MRKQHKWSDEERESISRDYKGTHASAKEIADRLGVTQHQVRHQVYKMGLGVKSDRHPWDPNQDQTLRELIPKYSVTYIAALMHRSINSVVVRSKRLGLHRRIHDGWYTKTEVCEILGVDHHWVQRRIDCGALKATYHNGRRPTKYGMAMWHIAEKDLKAFIRRFPQDLNGRNVDLITIVNVLVGVDYNQP